MRRYGMCCGEAVMFFRYMALPVFMREDFLLFLFIRYEDRCLNNSKNKCFSKVGFSHLARVE